MLLAVRRAARILPEEAMTKAQTQCRAQGADALPHAGHGQLTARSTLCNARHTVPANISGARRPGGWVSKDRYSDEGASE